MKNIRIYPGQDIGTRKVLYTVCEATDNDIENSYKRTHTKRGQIPVIMLNEDDKMLNVFTSIQAASKHTGITAQNISRVLDDSKLTAGGFRWRRQ